MSEIELRQRLEKLERNNRRLKWLGIAALALVAGLVTIAATQPVPDKIVAHEFDMVDSTGKIRIRMGLSSEGMPGIVLSDAQGKPRAAMTLSPSGESDIGLSDAQGKPRVLMSADPSGEPEIDLSDSQGNARVEIGVDPVMSGISVLDAQKMYAQKWTSIHQARRKSSSRTRKASGWTSEPAPRSF
jgi:hypothetical protein